LNNDVISGVVCGQTASPPGCSPVYSVDSTHVRLYANTVSTSNPSQSLSRSIKMYYDEKIRSQVKVPMQIDIINQQDRIGRGGDHIPFSNYSVPASRFTSANEHGNANTSDPNYHDHQHTSDDILGVDTTGDGTIDTFYVDKNYLARNTVINGISAAQLALGPETPDFDLTAGSNGLEVEILNPQSPFYRVGIYGIGQTDFESVYRFNGGKFLIPGLQTGQLYYVSVAAIDGQNVMSPFSVTKARVANETTDAAAEDSLNLKSDCQVFGNYEFLLKRSASKIRALAPNPATKEVRLDYFLVGELQETKVELLDMSGKTVKSLSLPSQAGSGKLEIPLDLEAGSYLVILRQNNTVVQSKTLLIN